MKFVLLALILSMLCACTGGDIHIVQEFGHRLNPDFYLYQTEIVTEVSTQIMMVKVISIDDIEVKGKEHLSFRYTAEVEEIFLDAKNAFDTGSTFSLACSSALMKANDAAQFLEASDKALQYGILQEEYGPDDYILSASCDAVPIEVGNTYLLYLSDHRLEESGSYAMMGIERYLCKGSKVYTGSDRTEAEYSTKDLAAKIRRDVENRTGRADEIGSDAYLEEIRSAHYDRNQTEE